MKFSKLLFIILKAWTQVFFVCKALLLRKSQSDKKVSHRLTFRRYSSSGISFTYKTVSLCWRPEPSIEDGTSTARKACFEPEVSEKHTVELSGRWRGVSHVLWMRLDCVGNKYHSPKINNLKSTGGFLPKKRIFSPLYPHLMHIY